MADPVAMHAVPQEPTTEAPTANLSTLTKRWSNKLSFHINGQPVELNGSSVDPRATLLDWIRSQPRLTGTKLGCGEGGCGACTVCIQSKGLDGKIIHRAINACLAPLALIDGMHVITVEGIGSSKNPHPVSHAVLGRR
jgi:xanthine dehydrogenase/oxidase